MNNKKLTVLLGLLLLLFVCTVGAEEESKSSSDADADAEAVERFRNYVRISTAHPNPEYAGARDFVIARAREIGLESRSLEFAEGKPVIILTWRGSKPWLPSILLNSHMDSVPAEAQKWVYPPFSAHRDEHGNIFARGAQDDKCIAIQYLEAIQNLRLRGLKPTRTVHLSFVPDEEIGGFHGFQAFASSREFEDLRVGFMLDEGQASPSSEFRVFYADRIPWRLLIRASGAPGHGSKLYDNSAMQNLGISLEAVARFRASQFDLVKAGIKQPGEIVSINSVYLKAGTPAPTPSGFVMNLQPSEAQAGFDIRLPPTADPQAIRQRIEAEWSPSWRNMTYQLLAESPLRDVYGKPLLTATNSSNPWWVLFEKAVTAAGGKLKEPEILMSTTDARFARAQGIPVLGFSPMTNTPVLFHDHNEFLNERIYLKGIEVYMSIIESLSTYEEEHGACNSKTEL